MKVVESIAAMREERASVEGTVGFVPTMGYLHEGHLSLVRMARAECDAVAVSIFVNPTQFAPHEDLDTYPRDEARDLEMLEREGVDFVFLPKREEIYPAGFDTYVVPGAIASRLEGASRPLFFRGVATVVTKLFNAVQPHRAYFGRKDAQQLLVVRHMVRDLDMDIEIVPGATAREPDGLAMSSRNAYLDAEQRRAALVLHKSLKQAEEMWQAGERDAAAIRSAVEGIISAEPQARIDYVSIADVETLEELQRIEGDALVSLAVFVGKVRLIDNITLAD